MTTMPWWAWERAEAALRRWVRQLIHDRPYDIAFYHRARPSEPPAFVDFDARTVRVDPAAITDWGGAHRLPRRWAGRRVASPDDLAWLASRALARHEAGHILFTTRPRADGPLHRTVTAFLEEERMERATARLFRPAGPDFVALGRLVWEHTSVFGATPDAQLVNAVLLWRWDRRRPRGSASKLVFVDPRAAARWDAARPLVESAWEAATSEDVAEIAREVLAALDLRGIDPLPPGVMLGGSDGEVLGVRGPGDAPLTGLPVAGAPLPEGDDAGAGLEPEPEHAPTVDVDGSAGELLLRPYRALASQVRGRAARTARALALPTEDVAPRPSRGGGIFDVATLLRSHGRTPFVRARSRAVDPRGTAIVALIDRTGSMGCEPDDMDNPSHRMTYVRPAVMELDLACERAGVALAIGYLGNQIAFRRHEPPVAPFRRTPLVWIRDFDTPWASEGPRALIAGMYGDANRECVSEGLTIAAAKLRDRPEEHRVVLVIHDGEPTDEPREAARATVDRVRRGGVTVIGVYLGDQREVGRIVEIFGREGTIGLADVTELGARLGRLLVRLRRAV